MKMAKIAELKNNLSRDLDHVRSGGSVTILDRDRPVARIVPLGDPGPSQSDSRARLARLERRGLIRRGAGGLPDWLGKRRPPRLRRSVLREFLQERRSGCSGTRPPSFPSSWPSGARGWPSAGYVRIRRSWCGR
ncbi:MAG: type II toxin-antitoxin system Phd/YefM family antitoxin [Candidatus Rokuibacteriota bacterium]